MMKINYSYYKIDTSDIKDYERSLILLNKTSDKLGLKILNKIEAMIFKNGQPVLKSKDYNNGTDKYFKDYLEKYEEAHSDLRERFNLNFFMMKGDCFHYNENIIIDKNDPEFGFWFALKLRQYEFNLSEIENFLKFQLSTNFDGRINKFIDFLKFNIAKHQSQLLDVEVVEKVNNLIQHRFENRPILVINNNNLNLFDALRPYFEKKDRKKLEQLLNGEEIQNKICFRGNANKFLLVFRQLYLNQRVVGKLSNIERWICEYFTYINKKDEVTDFSLGYVHKIIATNSRTVKKSNRINVPGLEHIIINKDN